MGGIALAAAASLLVAVRFLTLLYRCWRVVQAERIARPAGVTVGLLFVPFVNLAWQFMAIADLAREMRGIAYSQNGSPPPDIRFRAVIYCVLQVVALVVAWGIRQDPPRSAAAASFLQLSLGVAVTYYFLLVVADLRTAATGIVLRRNRRVRRAAPSRRAVYMRPPG